MWRVSERQRLGQARPTVTEDMMLARRYFQEAVKLDPSDARYRGFLAGATIAEGNIHKDERLTREGYFLLRDSIRAWPEFNLFTGGFVMSRLPPDSPRFVKVWSGSGEHWTNAPRRESTERTPFSRSTWRRKRGRVQSAPVGIPGLCSITSKAFF